MDQFKGIPTNVCMQISTNDDEGTFEYAIYTEDECEVYAAGSVDPDELITLVREFSEWQAESRFLTES